MPDADPSFAAPSNGTPFLRAYRHSQLGAETPALEISGDGNWFKFTGPDAEVSTNGKQPAAKSIRLSPEVLIPWNYRRVELIADDQTLIIVLPTANGQGTNNQIFNDGFLPSEVNGELTQAVLTIQFRIPCLIGNKQATIGFKSTLARGSTDGRVTFFTSIRHLVIGHLDKKIASNTGLKFETLATILDNRYRPKPTDPPWALEEWLDDNKGEGPFLNRVGNGTWTRKDAPPELTSRKLKIGMAPGSTPTLQISEVSTLVSSGGLQIASIKATNDLEISYLVQQPSPEWLKRIPGPEWTITGNCSLIDTWNGMVERYREALSKVRSPNKLSLLPRFTRFVSPASTNVGSQHPAPWSVRWGVSVAADLPPVTDGQSNIGPDKIELQVLSALPNPGGWNYKVYFPFESNKSDHLCTITAVDEPQPNTLSFQLQYIEDFRRGLPARIGSLDLTFFGSLPTETPRVSSFVVHDLGLLTEFKQDSPAPGRVPVISAKYYLPVLQVEPAGQDGLPASEYAPEGYSLGSETDIGYCDEVAIEQRFQGSAPLVISLAMDNSPARSPFWIEVDEANWKQYSQTVSIKLHVVDPPAADKNASGPSVLPINTQRALVLDSTPFLVAEVVFPAFHRRTSGNYGDVVALWNMKRTDGAAWELLTAKEPFDLLLPPQGIGEEMPKAKELADKDSQKGSQEPLDYRFSPPARLTLEGSYTPQNFTEAPWNLRRILGYTGQRDAGAGIRSMHYELLYGLSSIAKFPMLRLAELFAIVGRVAGRLEARDKSLTAYAEYRKRWSLFVALYNSRVAVLEPRVSGANYGLSVGVQGATDNPTVLTLTDGVKSQFRDADLYYPGRSSPLSPDDVFDVKPDGLKGGATWGFESARIYHASVRNPESTSSTLVNPYFSAMGGSGFQKASFDNGLTSLYSNTAFGRSFFYSVERMGRIGVYHNLARHVIEYERSVVPGDQFKDSQTAFAGRPVLRKMREFIQVLEPRSYLSSQKNAYPECGFVKAIEFKTQIIPVDSNWGANVGQTGWKIPLWQRSVTPATAAGKPAAYSYVKPEIVFDLAGAEGADVECAISDPEKLFFYTDTELNPNPDPHLWPLVEGVDFSTACVPTQNPGFTTANINELQAHDTIVPVGLAAFTLTLEEGHGRANLVHGRTDKALGTTVRSVTIQRPGGTKPDRQVKIEEITNGIRHDLFLAIRGNAATALGTSVNDLTTKVAALQATLTAQVNAGVAAVSSVEQALFGRWLTAVKQATDRLQGDLASHLAAIPELRTANTIDVARSALKAAVHDELTSLFQRLNDLPFSVNALCQFAANCLRAISEARRQLARLQDDIKQAYANGTQIKAAQDTLIKVRVEFEDVWMQAQTAVNARVETWMPGASLVIQFFGSAITAKFGRLDSVLADATSTAPIVNAAIDDLISPLDQVLATLQVKAKNVSRVPDSLLKAEKAIEKIADDQIDTTLTAVNLPLPINVQTALGLLNKAVGEPVMKEWIAQLVRLAQMSADIGNDAKVVSEWLQSLVLDASSELTGLLNQLVPANAADRLEDLRRKAEAALGRYLDSLLATLPPVSVSLPNGDQAAILLQRAFGASPRIPNLGFSLPDAAYFFDPALKTINLTPLLSQVQDLGSALSPLSTMMPSLSLLDRPIPLPSLKDFDLSSIFPNFAGLKLDSLFPALKMPDSAGENIKITHGLDQTSKRAWVQADIDISTDTQATLFSIGPVALQLPKARFQSQVKLQIDATGQTVRQVTGFISGDWNLMIGGSKLIVLRETSLSFDEQGHIHFNVDPTRVELAAALQFIQSIIQLYSPKDSGFAIYPSLAGIETRLVLPIPNTSVGTTGITNLTFGFNFGLKFVPFTIETGFSLGRAQVPFNISIFILGGAGHVEVMAAYTPGKSITCSVEIELAASASLALALGPISGYVAIFVGMSVRFKSGPGGDLRLGVFLLVVGEASILGIISAYISLRLEATYANGQFTGRGEFRISIKICWCFTLEVSESVTCTLGSPSGQKVAFNDPPLLGPDLRPVSDAPTFLFAAAKRDYSKSAQLYIDMIS